MLIKYCPECKKPMLYGKSHCDDCIDIVRSRTVAQRAQRAKEYNRNRDKKYVNFYQSANWKRLRAKKLLDCNYHCERCKSKGVIKIAEDVHHIVPLRIDWDKRLDYNNLLSVCIACHKKIEPKNYLGGRG